MAAYRKQFTLEDSGKLVLSGLPFSPGARVEVTIEEAGLSEPDTRERLAALFQMTDMRAEAKAVSPEVIAAEIAAYRAGQ